MCSFLLTIVSLPVIKLNFSGSRSHVPALFIRSADESRFTIARDPHCLSVVPANKSRGICLDPMHEVKQSEGSLVTSET